MLAYEVDYIVVWSIVKGVGFDLSYLHHVVWLNSCMVMWIIVYVCLLVGDTYSLCITNISLYLHCVLF